MAMNFFEAAIGLTSLGCRIFPLIPGTKRPAVKAWQKIATDDPEVFDKWAAECNAYNIGLACGSGSGVVVIDVDTKGEANGIETLGRLSKQGKKLPPCPMAATPSGGRHLFFKAHPGIRNGAGLTKSGRGIGPGIDFRGNGGYVVAAPSILDDREGQIAGKYRWIYPPVTADFPKLPDWCIRALNPKPEKPRPEFTARDADGSGEESLERIASFVAKSPEGQRNNSLYWAVRECAKIGIARNTLIDRLTEAGIAVGLDHDEIVATICSGTKAGGLHK